MKRKKWLELERAKLRSLVEAAHDASRVSGLTHNHYRYPARFSPQFVSAAIDAFTRPGDLVFDPFMGGGTTLVEALSKGRRAAGLDISSLALFVTQAKTQILSDTELSAVLRWSQRLPLLIDMHLPTVPFPEWEEAGYYRNLKQRSNWRLLKAIEQALASAVRLRTNKSRQLARCIVLRTAQWALDGRKTLPSIERFRSTMAVYAKKMVEGAEEFRRKRAMHKVGKARCLNRSVVGVQREDIFSPRKVPKLILTSPPYPGIHVLYHRWQVDGRKETPAPFWIANKLDGAGNAYYTMGDRKNPGLKTYFENMLHAFSSIAECANNRTTVAQVVAFSDPDWQLPRYLEMMEEAGFSELHLRGLGTPDGRLWRAVPSRKWYADQRGEAAGGQEVVLFHRLSGKGVISKKPSRKVSAQSPSA